MPLVEHNSDTAKILRRVPRKGIPGYASDLREILSGIIKALPFKLSVDGADISVIEGGFHLHLAAAAAAAEDPWTLRTGSSATKRLIRPGTFGGLSPEIGSVRLDNATPPELTITASAVNYLYLRCQFTLVTVDSFITGASIAQGDVTVIASATATAAALDSPGSGLFHVAIATIDATGLLTAQPYHSSLDWTISDTGAGASLASLTVFT